MSKIFSVLLALSLMLVLSACQSIDHSSPKIDEPVQSVTESVAPINVYSTYLSDGTARQCQQHLPDQQRCKDDAIRSTAFFTALTELDVFSEISPSASLYDYELLIANQMAEVDESSWFRRLIKQIFPTNISSSKRYYLYTEITLQWRGIELDSFIAATQSQTLPSAEEEAGNIIHKWWQHARNSALFDAAYLFNKVGASNYPKDLQLPEILGDFYLSDRQLHHDPFKGAIARYLHPEYDDAIVDIVVYPILQPLQQPVASLLIDELTKAQNDAQTVAQARGLALNVDAPIQPFTGPNNATGYYFALHATHPEKETLFATVYLFQQQDKYIKVSTTFPPRVGDQIATQAINAISVPKESTLMKQIRQL